MPSQPSFWMPGRPARNLSVTSLPRPALRKRPPGMSSSSSAERRRAVGGETADAEASRAAHRGSCRGCGRGARPPATAPSGVTMLHDARLSSAVPHSTAFLPPAFIATLPPMQEASAEVGIDREHQPVGFGRLHHAPGHHAGAAVDGRHRLGEARAARRCSTAPRRFELLGVDHGGSAVQRHRAAGVAGAAAARNDGQAQLDAARHHGAISSSVSGQTPRTDTPRASRWRRSRARRAPGRRTRCCRGA